MKFFNIQMLVAVTLLGVVFEDQAALSRPVSGQTLQALKQAGLTAVEKYTPSWLRSGESQVKRVQPMAPASTGTRYFSIPQGLEGLYTPIKPQPGKLLGQRTISTFVAPETTAVRQTVPQPVTQGRLLEKLYPETVGTGGPLGKIERPQTLEQKVAGLGKTLEDQYLAAQRKYLSNPSVTGPIKKAWEVSTAVPRAIYDKTYGKVTHYFENNFYEALKKRIPEITREESDKIFALAETQYFLLRYPIPLAAYFLDKKYPKLRNFAKDGLKAGAAVAIDPMLAAAEKRRQKRKERLQLKEDIAKGPREIPYDVSDIAMVNTVLAQGRAADQQQAAQEKVETFMKDWQTKQQFEAPNQLSEIFGKITLQQQVQAQLKEIRAKINVLRDQGADITNSAELKQLVQHGKALVEQEKRLQQWINVYGL